MEVDGIANFVGKLDRKRKHCVVAIVAQREGGRTCNQVRTL